MNGIFKVGQKLTSVNGFEYSVSKKLGEGGQGEIYEVMHEKSSFALKWYFENMAKEEQKLVKKI